MHNRHIVALVAWCAFMAEKKMVDVCSVTTVNWILQSRCVTLRFLFCYANLCEILSFCFGTVSKLRGVLFDRFYRKFSIQSSDATSINHISVEFQRHLIHDSPPIGSSDKNRQPDCVRGVRESFAGYIHTDDHLGWPATGYFVPPRRLMHLDFLRRR